MSRVSNRPKEERTAEIERLTADSIRQEKQDIIDGKIVKLEYDAEAMDQSFKDFLDEHNIVL
jgi:hypothetical protein